MLKQCIVSLIVLLLLVSFAGCIVNEQGEKNSISGEYDMVVDDDFTEESSGWQVTHFQSISDAVNETQANQTIFVHAGFYKETLLIDKKLNLIGEDANTTIIDGGQIDDVISVISHGKLIMTGFTITNCSTDDIDSAGIDLRTLHNHISGNIFRNNTNGIYTRYADYNNITRNLFVNNSSYGLYHHTSSDHNRITDNIFLDNRYGLRIKGSTGNQVYYNLFVRNQQRGIYLCCGANKNYVVNNSFIDNLLWDGYDHYFNYWDDGSYGNFWDSYHLPEHGAFDNDSNGIIDAPYVGENIKSDDEFPLVSPPEMHNPFARIHDFR